MNGVQNTEPPQDLLSHTKGCYMSDGSLDFTELDVSHFGRAHI